MMRTFEYRIYPRKEQEILFEETLDVLRHLYNNALAERIDAYKHENRTVGYLEQKRQLPDLKKMAPSLKNIHSQVLQDCLHRLDKAYQNFFRRFKEGHEKAGFPRFKGTGQYQSFAYPQYGTAAQIQGNILILSKIGNVEIRVHRPLGKNPKTVTITRKADGWYACIVCDIDPEPLPLTGMEVGIDVGIKEFATFSEEHPSVPNPKYLKKAQAKLRKAQKRLSRRTKVDPHNRLTNNQSRRRDKAKVLLAKAHQKVARARKDFHHKTAYALVRKFDVLSIEDLNIKL